MAGVLRNHSAEVPMPATVVKLSDFGYVADDLTDNRAAWRAAITYADTNNIRVVEVPSGVGRTSQIVGSDFALPPGLTFQGSGQNNDGPYDRTSRIRFTGTDALFDIDFPTGGPSQTGYWRFEALSFETVDPSASIFSINRPASYDPSDTDNHRFVMNLVLDGIYGVGTGSGTGDFLKAAKLFQLQVLANCEFAGWRRAFWLKGCDNCYVSGRMYSNNRHVMLQGSGTFGNDNVVDLRYAGNADPRTGEDAYMLWDSASKTTLQSGGLFEQTPGSGNLRAYLYLNGYGGRYVSPFWSNGPLFELGPDARECVLEHPTTTVLTPPSIVSDGASTDYGYAQEDLRLRITHASRNAQLSIGRHPRLIYVDPPRATIDTLAADREMVIVGGRAQPRNHFLSAANWWGISTGQPGGGRIRFVGDADTSAGHAVRCDRQIPGSCFSALLRVGRELARTNQRVQYRAKLTGALTTGEWVTIITRNGQFHGNVPRPATGSYAPYEVSVDLSGWNEGDVFGFVCYPNGSPNVSADFDYVAITPVAAAN
ncbi:hypothetical protein [Sphingomonas sp. VNH70]|uniref:hypothetical protein n=1 Tax=Sphingomonas silueang TaxID=3156617 RepID=UPI0032B4F720